MPESETEPHAAERERKPALPPFGGAAAASGPVLRPATDLRGRRTLPPFFGPPIRPGGPLPGATARPPAPAVGRPRPSIQQRPVARPVSVAEPTPTRPTPQTPPAPSWDTPPTPLAAAFALNVSTRRADPATSTSEAEWAAPVAEPEQRQVREERVNEAPATEAAEPVGVEPPAAYPAPETAGDHDFQADPEYATRTHESLPMAAGEASPDRDAVDAPPVPRRRVTPILGMPAHVTPVTSDRVLPPSLFADQALTDLEAAPADVPGSEQEIAENMRSDDINDMFAEQYDAPRPAPQPAPVTRRPYRTTPPLGTARPGRTTPSSGRAQEPPRFGRRVTPVLGAHAITPISVPQIRRTPMAPPIAIPELPPASVPSAPPPRQIAFGAVAPSPTPAVVPALDLAASRAIAYALETVANRIRAGQIVVAGQVPAGDNVASLAAAVAAALAALLGVQR